MKMYIAIFNNINHGITGKLCKWVTGYADYHIGITDLTSFWDQDILFRKRQWMPRPETDVTLYECPVELTPEELDNLVMEDVVRLCMYKNILGSLYGFRDYIGFGIRKLGFKFKYNFPGVVCSGRVRDILYSKGWKHLGSPDKIEPSPADIRRKFKELEITCIKQGSLQ